MRSVKNITAGVALVLCVLICIYVMTLYMKFTPDEPKVLSDGTVLPCRTLLIAAGLRPDRSLLHGLPHADWLQLCGNCNRVHPMVESVTEEGKRAGIRACRTNEVAHD